jgi:AsmA protein
MKKFDVDVRMSAAQLTIGSAKLGRTAVAANMRSGKLAVTIGESQAYGGIITGSFALAAGADGADAKSQMRFANVDLGSCLAQLFDVKRVEGKGNLGFALEANGNSIDALTRTLTGTVNLTSLDGALTGLNVEQLLRRLERRPLSGTADFRTGRTPYDRFNVALKIVDGVATADDIHLEGPTVKLLVSGTTTVPTRDLDLQGTATLIGTGSEQSFELPFIVRGSWDSPMILPDAQSLIRRSDSAAPLLNAVRDRKARDAVRSAIDRLTGSTPRPPASEDP